MKLLYLIRHGKSSWDDPDLSDQERPLRKRGERNAKVMAKVLKKKGIEPQYFLSSPALRALATARIFAKKFDYGEKKIGVNKLLYFEGADNILTAVQQLDDQYKTVFAFGHNPDFTEVANHFSTNPVDNVPTCGVVGVEFKIDAWKEASFNNGKMIFFDYPSNH